MPESFVKWVGSKKKMAPLLVERFAPALADGADFNDLFVGSGAVTFALLDKSLLDNRIVRVADTSDEVLALLEATLRQPFALAVVFMTAVRSFPPATHYLDFRGYYNDLRRSSGSDPLEIAAGLIYISRFGFNGLWRVNRKGDCNVPPGSACQSEEAVGAVVGLVRDRCLDWLDAGTDALFRSYRSADDLLDEIVCSTNRQLVYADPPYHKTFNGYSKVGSFDTPRLIDRLEHLNVDQFTVFLSNSPDALPLLNSCKWKVEMVSRSGSVSCNGAGRQRVSEILAKRI